MIYQPHGAANSLAAYAWRHAVFMAGPMRVGQHQQLYVEMSLHSGGLHESRSRHLILSSSLWQHRQIGLPLHRRN